MGRMTEHLVFLSYSRANADLARGLYEELEKRGVKVWRDRNDLEAGNDWWRQIQDTIRDAHAMVLCMSPAAVRSDVVAAEWHFARQVGTRVIPVVAEAVDFADVPRWMARLDWLDVRLSAPERDIVWAKLVEQLKSDARPRKVPFMVDDLPADLVHRPEIVEAVVPTLTRDDGTAPVVVLEGAGGYGKTTLLRSVCHDLRVRAAFDDGALWVTLGSTSTEDARIGRIKDLIHAIVDESPPVTTLEAAKAALRDALADRHLILVIDDVWKREHLAPFLEGGRQCARLVSTRLPDVIPDIAPERLSKRGVDRMPSDQAERLLARGLAHPSAEGIAALSGRLGAWPLLLKLVNGALRQYVTREGLAPDEAIQEANLALTRRGLTVFDDGDADARDRAVAATLDVGIGLLSGDDERRYRRLAIFPGNTTVPIAALARLWQVDDFDARQTCRRLAQYGLVAQFGRDGIRLHDVVRQYLREAAGADLGAWNAEFLQRWSLAAWQQLASDEPYLWNQLIYHLIEAGDRATLSQVFEKDEWMRARVSHDDFRYDGFINDVAVAWAEASAFARDETGAPQRPNLEDCFRYALIRTSVNSLAGNFVPAVVSELVKRRLWPASRALSVAANIVNATQRLELYGLLLRTGALSEKERRRTAEVGWAAAAYIAAPYGFPTLDDLAPFLEGELLSRALETALDLPENASRAHVLAALIPRLEGDLKERVIEAALAAAHASKDPYDAVRVLKEVAETLDWDRLSRWREIVRLRADEHFAVLVRVIPRLDEAERVKAALTALSLLTDPANRTRNPTRLIRTCRRITKAR